jgi:nucleoside-diphosphate-sugar epimerase
MKLPENPLATDLEHILDHTRDLWDELRGEHIFITGGTGFFGSWLLESFAWANDKLGLNAKAVVLTRNPGAFQIKAPHLAAHPAIQFHPGDNRSFEYPPGKFSHIIHAATETNSKYANDPLETFNANIGGTQRILGFTDRCEGRKFLFTSSGAVYGRQPPEMTHIQEDYPGAPKTTELSTAYGQSKRTSEFLCTANAKKHGFQVTIARCFAFVGPLLPLDANYAIGNFIRDGLNGGPILVQGDGTPYRSYLYAADLAIWLWTILFKGQSGRPYNVGSEDDLSIAELGQVVANELSPKASVTIVGKPAASQFANRYVPSTKRAKMELGLESWIPIKEAIHRTVKFNIR